MELAYMQHKHAWPVAMKEGRDGAQATFLRDREQLTRTEEDEYQAAVGDATFRLHVLEMRLKRHEQRATVKFQELESCLASDPRLALPLAVAPAA